MQASWNCLLKKEKDDELNEMKANQSEITTQNKREIEEKKSIFFNVIIV